MVCAAVGSLHLHHPLKLETSLVKNIGSAVAALGDTDIVAEELGSCVISVDKVCNSLCSRNYISAVVACVVPAAAYVYLIACAVNCSH